MATASKLLSYKEWLQLPVNDETREECVNGVIETMPPAKWQHTLVVERLTRQLWRKLDEAVAMVVSSNFGLVIRQDPLTQRTPDIAVFLLANLIVRDGYIHSAPELAVEVLSPANTPARVRETLSDYASIRVPEVWVIGPGKKSVTVYRLHGEQYQATMLSHDAIVSPVRFPEVTIVLDSIWQ